MAALEDILASNNADFAQAYLGARGITSTKLLARLAPDEAAFVDTVVKPYIDGFTLDSNVFKADKDPILVRAALVSAWEDAGVARATELAQAVPPTSSALVALGGPPSPPGPGAAPPGRIPKELKNGEVDVAGQGVQR